MQTPGAERCLWLAVLYQGLLDAAKGDSNYWVGSDDFVEVCNLAEVNPDKVHIRFRQHGGEMLRAARGRSVRDST